MLPRPWFLLVALAFGVAVDAGNRCKRHINCYYGGNSSSFVPGTYETNGVLNSCVKGEKAGLCYGMECVYGRRAASECPGRCGTFDVRCVCVTQEYARNENQKTKDTIIVVGWVFFGLMFVVPAVGVGLLHCCCRQHRPSSIHGQQGGGPQPINQLQPAWKAPQRLQPTAPQMAAQQPTAPTQLSVTVPPGMVPGQQINVSNPAQPGSMVAAVIPPGISEGMSFIVQCQAPAPAQAFPVGGVAPGYNPHGPQHAVGMNSGRCPCCAHDPWCCGKFGFVYIPAVVMCLIAIGCLAGGYDFDVGRFWNGCESGPVG